MTFCSSLLQHKVYKRIHQSVKLNTKPAVLEGKCKKRHSNFSFLHQSGKTFPECSLSRELISYTASISDSLPLGTKSRWNFFLRVIIIAFETKAQETEHVHKELALKGEEEKKETLQ